MWIKEKTPLILTDNKWDFIVSILTNLKVKKVELFTHAPNSPNTHTHVHVSHSCSNIHSLVGPQQLLRYHACTKLLHSSWHEMHLETLKSSWVTEYPYFLQYHTSVPYQNKICVTSHTLIHKHITATLFNN